MKRVPVFCIIFATSLLSGCSGNDDAGDLVIETNKSVYSADETIQVRITNQTEGTIELLNCCERIGYVVERRSANNWEVSGAFSCLPNCDGIVAPLASGAEHAEEIQIANPGRYRLAGKQIDADLAGAIRTFYSREFTVQ